jgi:hypothetical protein
MTTTEHVASIVRSQQDFQVDGADDNRAIVRYRGRKMAARDRLFAWVLDLERAGFTVEQVGFGRRHGLPDELRVGNPTGGYYDPARDPHLMVTTKSEPWSLTPS